jgi:aspartyl-tRNA(Asn)/glutamyl-tRNA(Gln) amidotransferase subunit B
MRADVNVSVRKPGGRSAPAPRPRTSIRSASSWRRSSMRRTARSTCSRAAAASSRRPACSIRTRARRGRCAPRRKRTITAISPIRTCSRSSSDDFLADCRASLPELPDAKRGATRPLGIPPTTPPCSPPRSRPPAGSRHCSKLGDEHAVRASNWVISDLFGAAQPPRQDHRREPGLPAQAAELLRLVADGTLSGTLAKQVFEIMLETGEDPGAIVEERGLKQTSDTGAIDQAIADVLAANPTRSPSIKLRQGQRCSASSSARR